MYHIEDSNCTVILKVAGFVPWEDGAERGSQKNLKGVKIILTAGDLRKSAVFLWMARSYQRNGNPQGHSTVGCLGSFHVWE